MTRSSKQLRGTAYHEAGHAVAAFTQRVGIRRVTIVPEADTLGHMLRRKFSKSFRPDLRMTPHVRERIEAAVICLMAGGLAEAKAMGRRNHVGAQGDRQQAVDLASYVCFPPDELEAYLSWLHIRTRGLLDNARTWQAVELLAGELLAKQSLSGRAVLENIKRGLGG